MTTHLIITFHVKPESHTTFKNILKDVKKNLPSEPECLELDVFESEIGQGVFTLVEKWISLEAHQKHVEVLKSSGGWEMLLSHLKHEPMAYYYQKWT